MEIHRRQYYSWRRRFMALPQSRKYYQNSSLYLQPDVPLASLPTTFHAQMTESLSSSQNPLSAKLSQVLGASYTDYGIRSALEALGEQFSENTTTSRRQLRGTLELQDIQSS